MKFLAQSLLLYLSLLLNDVPIAQAIRLPIQGRIGGFGSSGLARRASISGTPDLSNQGNLQYQTNITVNGQQFQVLIDTGRCVPLHTTSRRFCADRQDARLVPTCMLWEVATARRIRGRPARSPMPLVPLKVCAAPFTRVCSGCSRGFLGPIKTATVELEGFKVPNQAFSAYYG